MIRWNLHTQGYPTELAALQLHPRQQQQQLIRNHSSNSLFTPTAAAAALWLQQLLTCFPQRPDWHRCEPCPTRPCRAPGSWHTFLAPAARTPAGFARCCSSHWLRLAHLVSKHLEHDPACHLAANPDVHVHLPTAQCDAAAAVGQHHIGLHFLDHLCDSCRILLFEVVEFALRLGCVRPFECCLGVDASAVAGISPPPHLVFCRSPLPVASLSVVVVPVPNQPTAHWLLLMVAAHDQFCEAWSLAFIQPSHPASVTTPPNKSPAGVSSAGPSSS